MQVMVIFSGYYGNKQYRKSGGYIGWNSHWQCAAHLPGEYYPEEGQTECVVLAGLGFSDGDEPGVAGGG